jgi:hypothetical protein
MVKYSAFKFTERELATILAALREWQNYLVRYGLPRREHFEGCKPLTCEEIDELCERINFGKVGRTVRAES